jgi:hypothetical protein
MDNLNSNLINLIASYKKTGQSDEVIKQCLWQLGMIPEMVESHLDYYNKHTAQVNKDINNIVKENKDMKLTLVKLHENAQKTISALEEMKSDNSLGFSASAAQKIIENCMAQLQITKDDEMVMQEKIKAGYAIDETLVNPVLKYTVAENMYQSLAQYDWLMPVSDLRNVISESFVADKWSYVSAKFAKAISSKTGNSAFDNLYESLVNTLIDEENVRFALKNVLLENSWNSDAKAILSSIVAEEKAEQGKVDNKIYENSSCTIRKNFSPCLIDENKKIFNLNGKNYIFDGEKLLEAAVSDMRYRNVLEGLSLMKYEADKDRFVYYGKNDMLLEMNCETLEIKLTGKEDFNDMSIIDMNETLKRCGIFDRETIPNCEKLVKMFESKEMLREIDCATTIQNDKFAGVFVSIINVSEGVYVNKVNMPFGINEMVLCESAKKACEEIKNFMKYDATKILEDRLKTEGEQEAIVESERNEIKDTLTFLNEKRSELIATMQETNNNEQIKSALELVESEIRKFEKQLQESYSEKKN